MYRADAELLTILLNKLTKQDLYPTIGIELEFYLVGSAINSLIAIDQMGNELGGKIVRERGQQQFEYISRPYPDILSIVSEVEKAYHIITKAAQEQGLLADFSPKPYPDDYGSSLQLNVSLHDKGGHNIFGYKAINDNPPLIISIIGLLEILIPSFYMLVSDNSHEFARFSSGLMAPCNVSWGGNNRTTAIRIPDSSPLDRRIEFRVPSAATNIQNILVFLLSGLLYGLRLGDRFKLDHLVNLYPRIYGDASRDEYNLVKFPSCLEMARENFQFPDIVRILL